MTDVVTITPNPAVDLSTSVDRILPVAKLRGKAQRRDPGGGGINVARVIGRLGGDARAIYPAGGAIGKLLRQLLDQEGVASHTWTISSSMKSVRTGNTASFFPVRGSTSPSGKNA
jgi:6-phosphofructokinase 2